MRKFVRPSQELFKSTLKTYWDELQKLIGLYARGEITLYDFHNEFYKVLAVMHAATWALGRQRAGDFTPMHDLDRVLGRGYADRQNGNFLRHFINDIKEGKYNDDEGKLKVGKVTDRSKLYIHSARLSANEAFIETSDDRELFDWVLGAVEKHCSECPTYAEMSPWKKDTLFAWPGSGDTPCRSNCKCYLKRRSDSVEGFKAVKLTNTEELLAA